MDTVMSFVLNTAVSKIIDNILPQLSSIYSYHPDLSCIKDDNFAAMLSLIEAVISDTKEKIKNIDHNKTKAIRLMISRIENYIHLILRNLEQISELSNYHFQKWFYYWRSPSFINDKGVDVILDFKNNKQKMLLEYETFKSLLTIPL
jgi:hypothetical protein